MVTTDVARTAIAVLVVLAATTSALADIINVPADWPTIQMAINNSMPGDEIVIAAGNYPEHIDTFGNDLTIRSATGDPESVTITGEDDFANVFVATGETVTLQAITIGNRGVFVHNRSTVAMNDCCFISCSSSSVNNSGGAVHVRGSSTLTATNCQFRFNSEAFGGAIGIVQSAATFETCTFEDNNGSNDAGAVSIEDANGVVSFTSCVFRSNFTSPNFGDGGALSVSSSSVALVACEFDTNFAVNGAGAYISSGALVTVESCVFRMNDDNAIRVVGNGSDCLIFASWFLCNTDDSAGGALYFSSSTTGLVDNSFFGLNEADSGGAMFISSSASVEISNTTFCGNHVSDIKGKWIDNGGNTVTTDCLAEPDPLTCDAQVGFCIWDLNGDGEVDVDDLVALILVWGTDDSAADFDGDGIVGVDDLVELVLNWGACS